MKKHLQKAIMEEVESNIWPKHFQYTHTEAALGGKHFFDREYSMWENKWLNNLYVWIHVYEGVNSSGVPAYHQALFNSEI